jgi:RimJ/RimL family protein N-acetyltransferase
MPGPGDRSLDDRDSRDRLLDPPSFRGRGIATRAFELLSAWAEDVGFARLQLTISPGNEASARVAAKAGYVEEGLLRAYANQRGAIKDASIWSRVKSD